MAVYFIRCNDLIKIGFSDNVRVRVAQVSGAVSFRGECDFIGHMPGDRKVERHLHDKFSADREYGEWFRISDELLSLIENLAIKDYPGGEKIKPFQRLQFDEETAVSECAEAIQEYFAHARKLDKYWAMFSETTGIPTHRLKAIHSGAADTVTAGEFLVLMKAREVLLAGDDEGLGSV